MAKALIGGVGMAPFSRPSEGKAYPAMVRDAVTAALADAGVDYGAIQQPYAGYVYGDSTSGQRALYPLGLTGIPVINVNNNCATGSTALHLAIEAVKHGAAECVLAVGFEQMTAGALASHFTDREDPLGPHLTVMQMVQGRSEAPFAAQLFGGAGREYMEKYGAEPSTFARIATKARAHAAHNPYAVFRAPVTLEEIMASPSVFEPLTRLQCCPPTSGAAAAIVASPAFAARHGMNRAVPVLAQALVSDRNESFEDGMAALVGAHMTRAAADVVYAAAGIDPTDLDVVELHDCFTANELITYEGLRLTPTGTAERFILDGHNSFGGKVVTNPSGGLLSKGHPLGATGLAQCAELVWQMRGDAERRQVEGARLALQHNLGLGGACIVTLYGRPH